MFEWTVLNYLAVHAFPPSLFFLPRKALLQLSPFQHGLLQPSRLLK